MVVRKRWIEDRLNLTRWRRFLQDRPKGLTGPAHRIRIGSGGGRNQPSDREAEIPSIDVRGRDTKRTEHALDLFPVFGGVVDGLHHNHPGFGEVADWASASSCSSLSVVQTRMIWRLARWLCSNSFSRICTVMTYPRVPASSFSVPGISRQYLEIRTEAGR